MLISCITLSIVPKSKTIIRVSFETYQKYLHLDPGGVLVLVVQKHTTHTACDLAITTENYRWPVIARSYCIVFSILTFLFAFDT